VLVDYYYYKKWSVVPLNIVLYNIFSGEEKGPNIYGTEPWWFYLANAFLNFNVVLLAALGSLPMLVGQTIIVAALVISLKMRKRKIGPSEALCVQG
jgi:alpha-1,2-mannosyltransferase